MLPKRKRNTEERESIQFFVTSKKKKTTGTRTTKKSATRDSSSLPVASHAHDTFIVVNTAVIDANGIDNSRHQMPQCGQDKTVSHVTPLENSSLVIPHILQQFITSTVISKQTSFGHTNGKHGNEKHGNEKHGRDVIQKLLLDRATAPLPAITHQTFLPSTKSAASLTDPTLGKKQYFWWKYAIDSQFPERPYHICEADRPWYIIKEELEKRGGLVIPKQAKKSLVVSSFLAYKEDEWLLKLGQTRQCIFDPSNPSRPCNLHGDYVVKKEDRLVLVRLPANKVGKIYKEIITLQFEEEQTEEQRIDQLLNFDAVPRHKQKREPLNYDEPPPAWYVCHNCNIAGHWIKDCQMGRRLQPKGIPKMFLQPAKAPVHESESRYVDTSGNVLETHFAPHVIK